MSLRTLLVSVLFASQAMAQSASSSSASSSTSSSSTSSFSSATLASASATSIATNATLSTITDPSVSVPTGSYISYSSTITLSSSSSAGNGTATSSLRPAGNGTSSSTTTSKGSIVVSASRPASTGSSTISSAAPTNTAACNNYPEFCTRKYSNITQVCAHNSAFATPNNLFSNQGVSITGQLNDGIRMIQGETHLFNGTMRNCHTSCNFLDAGPYSSLLLEVREWLDANPYDVVTLLIVNSDYVNVEKYTSAFEDSGMLDYVYYPPQIPMALNDWPTLSELILTNKRAIVFMDYQANQTSVPYILDEFSQMSETPFSPTDPAFPCSIQRPPGISHEDASNRLYLANHNLNLGISLAGTQVLIPNFADLVTVNGANGTNPALGAMAETCLNSFNRPPNFLLVDFYNLGNYSVNGQVHNGSVFDVAAKMNNVSYNRPCCGQDTKLTSGAGKVDGAGIALLVAIVVALAMM